MNRRQGIFLLALALPMLSVACLISEPPDIIKPPTRRPMILHGQEFPRSTRVLIEDPGTFYVPVEVVDPTTTYFWEVFMEFPGQIIRLDAVKGQVRTPGTDHSLDPDEGKSIRVLPFSLAGRLRDGQCHQITFRVGLSPSELNPQSTESDFVSWSFSPSGQVGGCVTLDGGLPDGTFPTGEAGTQTFDSGDVGAGQ